MMKKYLFERPDLVSERELLQDLTLLPAWRRAKALQYLFRVDRVMCCKAYLLLKEGLKKEYGILEDPEFFYGPFGKPMLKNNPGIFFSLSHCKKAVLCVIDDHEIGCDIEESAIAPDEGILDLCCNAFEKRKIQNSKDPSAELIRFWTKKEAYLKYTGEGLADEMQGVLERAEKEGVRFEMCDQSKEKGWIYAICRK